MRRRLRRRLERLRRRVEWDSNHLKSPRTVLVTDTREQLPLTFRPGLFDKYEVSTLNFGDYGLFLDLDVPTQVPIVMERKGLGDLFGTMGQGYDRFKAEMQRAKAMNSHMMLLVEGSIEDVWRGYEHSSISGDSMLKKLAMLRVRHDLEVHFFNTRREMARFVEEVFLAVVRNYSKKNSSTVSDTGVSTAVRQVLAGDVTVSSGDVDES